MVQGRGGGGTLIWRGHPTGTSFHVGHAHCDTGSFCFYRGGHPVLVDAGRETYMVSERGEFVRSALAHNSVCIDGLGPFPAQWLKYPLWYSQATVDTDVKEISDGFEIKIRHGGFRRLKNPVDVIRKITVRENELVIEDEIFGEGEHAIEWFFHFGDNLIQGERSNLITGRFGTATLDLDAGGACSVEKFRGREGVLGWYSPEYGKRLPSTVLKVKTLGPIPRMLKCGITFLSGSN